jgi:predicted small lipoprotein YifL
MWRRRREPGSSDWKKSESGAERRILSEIERAPALARTGQSLYGAARIGDFDVTRNDGTGLRWALILLGTAALLLGGCGRKGPLDLPPTASGLQPTAAAVQTDPTAAPQASQPSVSNPNYGSDQLPVAGKGPKRPFALDPLLNSN